MPSHPIVGLADTAKVEMFSHVRPGEIPGRVHPSMSARPVAVGAFNKADARSAAAEHGRTCEDEDCMSHLTLTEPSVRVMTVDVVPIFGARPIERLLTPKEARAMAGSLWAAADLAEAT